MRYIPFLFALFFLGCGDCDDGPAPGDDIAPGDVTFELISEGFWVQNGRYNQFIGVDALGRDYRNGIVNQTPIASHLETLGDGARLLLEFNDNGLSTIVATRVADGKIGYSRYLDSAGQFEQPIEFPIVAYQHRERLVLNMGPGAEETEFTWREECRWQGLPARNFFNNATGTFTRESDALIAGNQYSFLVRHDTCPVLGNIDHQMTERGQLHPDGGNGVVGFHMEGSALHINRFDNLSNEIDSAEISTNHTGVFQVRPQGQDYFLLMAFPTIQAQNGFEYTGRLKVTLGDTSAEAEEMPIPELPPNHRLERYRLLSDGRAFAWTQVENGAAPSTWAALIEEGSAWTSLDLRGTTEDGLVINLEEDGGFSVHPDMDGTIHAVKYLNEVKNGHPRRVSDEIPTLISIKDGSVTVRPLPALVGVRGLELDIGPENEVVLIAEWLGSNPPPAILSSFRVATGNFHNGDHRPELVITRLTADELTSVSGGVVGTFGTNVLDEDRYYGDPSVAGTAFLAVPHNTYASGVGLGVNNGWSRTWFKPYQESARPRNWSLKLVDAPEGAVVRILETGEECSDECAFTHGDGTFLSLEFETPPGWVVDGPKHCFADRLDAGFCSVYMDPTPSYCREGVFWRECEGEDAKPQEPVWEFTYSRSPVLAASTTSYIHENVNVRPDGSFSAEILVLNEDPLPDGTVVEGATTAAPGRVLSRWNKEEFIWAWYVPNFRLVGHAIQGQNVVAVLEAEGGVAQDIGGQSVPSGDYVRVVLNGQGEISEARVLNTEGLQDPVFVVLSNGGVLVGASAVADSVYGNAARVLTVGAFSASGAQPALAWELDSQQAFRGLSMESATGGAIILANGHLLTVSAGLTLGHASELDTSVSEVTMGRSLDENFLAFLAEETIEIQGLTIPVTEPSVVSVRVGQDGVVDAPVVFSQAAPIDGDAIRSVSSAAGKRILIASAGSLTDETFYVEGEEPFTIGRRADGGNLEGFTSKTLMPLEGGELLWVTRGWSNTFRVRPYSASGGVVFRLDAATLATLKDTIL